MDKENRRISAEIKKVFSSCQIILFLLDIRNPLGTWPPFLYQKNKYKSKKILLILNKCDLVPFWVLEKWLKILSQNFLVFGFFCKKNNQNGKRKIIAILRKMKKKFFPHKNKVFIGIVGYPNVGKSSFINTLMGKKCSDVSPIPGQTKIWQFIKLTKNIFLIDSPGIILGEDLSKKFNILKGATKIDRIMNLDPKIIDSLFRLVGKIEKKKNGNSKFANDINLNIYKKEFSLDKGGKKNDELVLDKIIKAFLSGLLPWFSPIPAITWKKTNTIKIVNWYYIN
jgi:nuclear GTP-binding protein